MKAKASKKINIKIKVPTKKNNAKKQMNKMLMKQQQSMPFGPISTISTAPVAIGNSISGSDSLVTNKNGIVTVTGRDFMFPAKGSGSVTTWTLVGGTPITPCAFSDSYIRSFLQLYQKFKIRKIVAHYITSSSTSSTGDVMFYFGKNRDSVFLNQTSTQLLPFVMSDKNTVLGPQWSNHSTVLDVRGQWKSTDYGMEADLDQYSEGELYLLSKTSTTDSPGYVIFDYVIDFCEMNVSPRLNSLPITRIQYFNTNFVISAANVTAGVNRLFFSVSGNDISGTAASTPSNATAGDIYKVIFDNSNSVGYTNCTASTALQDLVSLYGGGISLPVTIQDGTTLYAVYDGAHFELYPNADAAYAQNSQFRAGVTATISISLLVWLSYVGCVANANFNPNF